MLFIINFVRLTIASFVMGVGGRLIVFIPSFHVHSLILCSGLFDNGTNDSHPRSTILCTFFGVRFFCFGIIKPL